MPYFGMQPDRKGLLTSLIRPGEQGPRSEKDLRDLSCHRAVKGAAL